MASSSKQRRKTADHLSATQMEPRLNERMRMSDEYDNKQTILFSNSGLSPMSPIQSPPKDTYKRTFNVISERILDRLESQGLPLS